MPFGTSTKCLDYAGVLIFKCPHETGFSVELIVYNEIDRHSIREVSKDVCDVSEAMSVSAFYKDLIVIIYNYNKPQS